MSGPTPSPGHRDPRPRSDGDETDYQHRNFINLVAAIVVLAIAIGIVWVVKEIEADEALNRCLATGRRDCVLLDAPVHPTIRKLDD